ncbi:hypothetical protein ACWEPI_39990 [Streptomyces sp. NPDC004262]
MVDVTITDVALPDIRAVLHLDETGQQRMINAYPPTGTTSRMPKTAASPMAMGLEGGVSSPLAAAADTSERTRPGATIRPADGPPGTSAATARPSDIEDLGAAAERIHCISY